MSQRDEEAMGAGAPRPRSGRAVAAGLAAAGLAALVLTAVSGSSVAQSNQGLVWRADHDVALADARHARRPAFVYFTAIWAQACTELERHVFTDPRVQAELRHYELVRVGLSPDADSVLGRAILDRYHGRGLPLMVIVGADGEIDGRVDRFIEPEELVRVLRRGRRSNR